MTYMPKNKKEKKPEIGFGEKTQEGYKYGTRINFKEDLASQITRLIQEKKAKDELEKYVEQICRVSSQFKNKEKNLNYYKTIGEILSFLNNDNFKNIKPYSVFRRLIDEIPDVLPRLRLDNKRIQDHLMMMYRIGNLDKRILGKATWEQWYEISKFKNVIRNKDILKKVIKICKDVSGGPDLRNKIKEILKGN